MLDADESFAFSLAEGLFDVEWAESAQSPARRAHVGYGEYCDEFEEYAAWKEKCESAEGGQVGSGRETPSMDTVASTIQQYIDSEELGLDHLVCSFVGVWEKSRVCTSAEWKELEDKPFSDFLVPSARQDLICVRFYFLYLVHQPEHQAVAEEILAHAMTCMFLPLTLRRRLMLLEAYLPRPRDTRGFLETVCSLFWAKKERFGLGRFVHTALLLMGLVQGLHPVHGDSAQPPVLNADIHLAENAEWTQKAVAHAIKESKDDPDYSKRQPPIFTPPSIGDIVKAIFLNGTSLADITREGDKVKLAMDIYNKEEKQNMLSASNYINATAESINVLTDTLPHQIDLVIQYIKTVGQWSSTKIRISTGPPVDVEPLVKGTMQKCLLTLGYVESLRLLGAMHGSISQIGERERNERLGGLAEHMDKLTTSSMRGGIVDFDFCITEAKNLRAHVLQERSAPVTKVHGAPVLDSIITILAKILDASVYMDKREKVKVLANLIIVRETVNFNPPVPASKAEASSTHGSHDIGLQLMLGEGNFLKPGEKPEPGADGIIKLILPYFPITFKGGKVDKNLSNRIKIDLMSLIHTHDQSVVTGQATKIVRGEYSKTTWATTLDGVMNNIRNIVTHIEQTIVDNPNYTYAMYILVALATLVMMSISICACACMGCKCRGGSKGDGGGYRGGGEGGRGGGYRGGGEGGGGGGHAATEPARRTEVGQSSSTKSEKERKGDSYYRILGLIEGDDVQSDNLYNFSRLKVSRYLKIGTKPLIPKPGGAYQGVTQRDLFTKQGSSWTTCASGAAERWLLHRDGKIWENELAEEPTSPIRA